MPTYRRWIHTKSCDFSPSGNLRLGQILMEPKDPAYILQPLGPLALEEYGIKPEPGTRDNLNTQDTGELSSHFSAWVKLGYVPVRFLTTVSSKRSHDYTWHFDKLDSLIMSPSIAYVKDAMRHGDVKATLENFKFKRRVYMVTGIRVVKGAKMTRKGKSSSTLKGAAEGTTPDQSTSTGTQGEFHESSEESEDFDKATDFVFAYRLNEVHYRGTVTHKPYTKGETESADKAPVQRGREIEINDFEVLKISDIPFAGSEADFTRVDLPEYEDIECFVAKE